MHTQLSERAQMVGERYKCMRKQIQKRLYDYEGFLCLLPSLYHAVPMNKTQAKSTRAMDSRRKILPRMTSFLVSCSSILERRLTGEYLR